MSVGFYSLQTCLDIIQASANPSASLPWAKRSLPRTSATHVFPQTFRGHGLQDIIPRVLAQKGRSFSVRQCFAAACVGFGSIGLPMLRGHLPANMGPPFRGASANLPPTFSEIRRLFWSSWIAVGNCSSSKRCVSCTQRHLTSSTVIVSPCFSMHAR